MKVLILAAGYGSRLERDIVNDTTGSFSHLIGVPKPLLPLAGKPLISYWFDTLTKHGLTANDIFLVTNARFHKQILEWCDAHGVPHDHVFNDQTVDNDSRLGAVTDLQLAIHHLKLAGDSLLIVGGDTLFGRSFDFARVLSFYNSFHDERSVVLYYVLAHDDLTRKTGIIEVDHDDQNRVVNFLEKPSPRATKSRFAAPCFYVLRPHALELVDKYMALTTTREERDAPGKFLAWLHREDAVAALHVTERIDVGRLEDYVEAETYFSTNATQ
jgi:NDP-sugar pyrophosphorylase family protein